MAGTIIADFIRTDANRLSLQVGNTTFATINASGFFSNTGTQLIAANGAISGASLVSGSITSAAISTAANTIPRSSMTTGAVLQVVQYNYTGATTISSGSYVSTPITANITPSSTSSKILVRVVVHCGMTGGNEGLHGQLWRNASVVTGARGAASASRDQAWFHCGSHYSAYEQYAAAAEYLDSPASISTLTYTVYARAHSSGSYPVNINTTELDSDSAETSRTISTITLMEIAG